jgi:2-succinyl-5-enolpyruvyl-6-hydroxy-3-cyclohexene-1-carboxylate synthase
VAEGETAEVWATLRGLDGVIVAGYGTTDPRAVVTLARRLGWPLLADHRSGCRVPDAAVTHFDGLLRLPELASAPPAVALRFGEPPASKVLAQWLDSDETRTVVALSRSRWVDPERRAALVVPQHGLAADLLTRIPPDYPTSSEGDRWLAFDAAARAAVASTLADRDGTTEPGVARAVVAGCRPGTTLVAASSMPVRDVEWFAENRRDLRVLANRGANGIDGLVATATGVALTGAPTTLLIGDVAFLHDSSSLTALARRSADLTVVVVNNDGGGIFSFLPQAESVAPDRFEALFGTPHGTDLVALCQAHGLAVRPWPLDGVFEPERGVSVWVATTDRADNVKVHRSLNEAVADAVRPLLGTP